MYEILRTYGNGVSDEEALELSKDKPMLSNLEHDELLSTDAYKQYKESYWCWTRTHIQYKKGATTAYVWNEGERKKTKIFLPLQDGWYLVNNKYGIPNGEPSLESNPKARKLWRWRDRDFDGLVSRDYYGLFCDGRRLVYCFDDDYFRLGVLVHSRPQAGKLKPDTALLWLKKLAKKNKNAKEILKRLK